MPEFPLNRLHALLIALGFGLGVAGPSLASTGAQASPPARLSETGLFAAGSPAQLRPSVVSFSPQYPLWSDNADKRRWMRLPAGKAIHAGNPDAWTFPIGTQLWKEFAHDGRPVETRYMQRLPDGLWQYAAYVWRKDGGDADLAPNGGATLSVRGAPAGRYAVPSRSDCIACHGGAGVPVLGVSALQLSPDRDPLAAHAGSRGPSDVDLITLAARGWLRGLPAALLMKPPRIVADTAVERAALGYLHANCGHCHNDSGNQAPVPLHLAQRAVDRQASRDAVLHSTVGAPSRYVPSGSRPGARVVTPGDSLASVLTLRMQSRHAHVQMPPLGTALADSRGLALIEQWIQHLRPMTP